MGTGWAGKAEHRHTEAGRLQKRHKKHALVEIQGVGQWIGKAGP